MTARIKRRPVCKVSDLSQRRCKFYYNIVGKSPLSQRATHSKTGRVSTAKLGRLTYFKSLRDIVNIAKIHRQYSWDVRGWCSVKKEGIFLSVDPFKEKS